ncbi:MAG: hypothetical protein K2O84_12485 [Oscillospiraceae bacterium]|nr:hypothetical protein [Oscillospiraceae bacterium]
MNDVYYAIQLRRPGVIEMVCCICYKITGHMDTAVHHCLNGGVIQQLL